MSNDGVDNAVNQSFDDEKSTGSSVEAQLLQADKSVPLFTVKGRYLAKCVSVYDGDTMNVVFMFNGVLTRWAVRLYGINTPEVSRTTAEEKKKGIAARDWVRERALGKLVWINCHKFEKYGRLLCDVYLQPGYCCKTLSDMLLEEGYAVEFMRTNKTTTQPTKQHNHSSDNHTNR